MEQVDSVDDLVFQNLKNSKETDFSHLHLRSWETPFTVSLIVDFHALHSEL